MKNFKRSAAFGTVVHAALFLFTLLGGMTDALLLDMERIRARFALFAAAFLLDVFTLSASARSGPQSRYWSKTGGSFQGRAENLFIPGERLPETEALLRRLVQETRPVLLVSHTDPGPLLCRDLPPPREES